MFLLNITFLKYISASLNFPGCTHADTGHYIIYADEINQLVVLSFDITDWLYTPK